MANIKNDTLKVDESFVYREANANFNLMMQALKQDKGVSMNVDEAYKSVYEIVDELRTLVKNKTVDEGDSSNESWTTTAVGYQSPSGVSALLDPAKSIEEIVDEGNFESLQNYVDSLSPIDFEPTLVESFEGGIPPDYVTTVYPYPNKSNLDPRRSGRFVKPKPEDVFKQVEVQKWLINNGLKYGFVLYGDSGLYYIGLESAKTKINASTDKEQTLQRMLRRFIKPDNTSIGLISVTAASIINTSVAVPAVKPAVNVDDLEYVETTGLFDNDGRALQLVVLDNRPVQVDTAKAFLKMQAEALRDGVNIKISSAYRPALGKTFTGVGSKGSKVLITTQESLRREPSRWIGYNKATMTPESFARSRGFADINDFVMNASSNAYKPATAKPKSSNHGIGAALDLNTGSRNTPSVGNFQPEVYKWLVKNSYKFGFVRVVSSEEWHFEYLPNNAANPYTKLAAGNDSVLFYSDLGLARGQFAV